MEGVRSESKEGVRGVRVRNGRDERKVKVYDQKSFKMIFTCSYTNQMYEKEDNDVKNDF